jgi:flagellar protein FlbD
MIKVTRLDGSEMYLNPDLLETLEEVPETHVTLSNGNRYLVLEPVQVIVDRIVTFKARIVRRSVSEEPRKYLRRRRGESYRPFCRLPE